MTYERLMDREAKQAWVAEHMSGAASIPPFSFTCGGTPSGRLLGSWRSIAESRQLDPERTELTRTWRDGDTGVEVRCVAVDYRDYPAIEWTVYLTNTGAEATPLFESVRGLDASFARGEAECVLHGIKGDFCTADSYEPYHRRLEPGATATFAPPPHSGKSCDGPEGFPYFNVQLGDGGMILAVGWPGQWEASFLGEATGVRVAAGQQLTRLRLMPGETVRTPLVALLFYTGGDLVESQNLWRRWYLDHVIPVVGGVPQPAVAQIQTGGGEADIDCVQGFLDAGIHVNLCWRDAGGTAETTWFPVNPGPFQVKGMAWLNSGTWEIDPAKYPNGFRPYTDWIHERGMQFVLWFEPERVGDPESWLGRNHPEWLLPGTSHGPLLDEGNPEARRWLTDHVSDLIESQGIDWYREDMNGGGPLPAWRKADAEDRQGITENLYVQGHLAFWDELRRRHPHLRIDSCASGGRRNDLETMRRAVPLLRSDFQFPNMDRVIEGNQGHTYGLSSWLPFQGTGCPGYDPYEYRSFYIPSFGMGGLTAANTAAQQKAYAECGRVASLMLLGDYYPLTPYSLELDAWIAWQFNRPEEGDGVIQAFRRAGCEERAQTYRLRGLEPSATYEVEDLDGAAVVRRSGKELMDAGLTVEMAGRPAAAVILYRRAS
jgi:alpha-galactosidase